MAKRPVPANMGAMPDLDSLLAAFDPADPAFIADPYPVLGALREATPLVYSPATDQWLVTRYDDVHGALRDRRLGRIFTHRYTPAEFGRPEPDPRWSDFREHDRWSLLELEPPDHPRIRSLIAKVFTPKAVADLRPVMEALSAELLGGFGPGDHFDLITEYAQPYSVAVICSMLGVPRADARQLLDWSHAIVKMYEIHASDEQKTEANTAAREFMDYARAVIADKRAHPDDLLVSRLATVEDAGHRLTDHEIACTTIVLLNAGHEATVNTLANGTRGLLRNRGEWERLVRREVEPRAGVEELIRWDAPLHLFERWVLDDDVTVAGTPLPRGSRIAMLFGSANRDPRRFADPDRFDVGRGDTAHVGFGGGIHFCVGAPLARLELEVSLTELRDRFPAMELAAEPTYHPTFVIRGLTALELAV